MQDKGLAIFRITRIITAVCVLAAAAAFIEGSFFRGFGDDEFIISCIFYVVFMPSLLYFLGYLIITRLPFAEESETDPEWFRKIRIGAMMSPLLIPAFGLFNSITRVFSLFGSRDIFENFIFGAVVALAFMLVIPIIPTANMIIIIYFYRKNRRKKNK